MKRLLVGVFGGTFNPIHYGHLRSARQLYQCLGLSELRLMPSAQPPQRRQPELCAEQRARLVRLAIEGEPGFVCDERELHRSGPSYTIDSLIELRWELGSERSIILIMGDDVLATLDRWHRWRELTELAHIVSMERPGHPLADGGAVGAWLSEHQSGDREPFDKMPAGVVRRLRLAPQNISATEIRDMLARGESVRHLMPERVWREIQRRNWYGYHTNRATGD